MQKVVGGYIEATYPYEEQVCIVCNDEESIKRAGDIFREALRRQKQA